MKRQYRLLLPPEVVECLRYRHRRLVRVSATLLQCPCGYQRVTIL